MHKAKHKYSMYVVKHKYVLINMYYMFVKHKHKYVD